MPVHAIIPPDETIAGGIVYAGNTWTINHNQLTGNAEGKRRKMIEALQDRLDNRQNVDDLPLDDPDHPDNSPGFNTYDDLYRRPDDSIIDELYFFYQQNPQTLWLVGRGIVCDIVLAVENDPTLNGNDRYSLILKAL